MCDSDSDSEGIDQENIDMCLKERQRDDDVRRFSFWMTNNKIPLPIEHWYGSARPLESVLGPQRGGTGHSNVPNHLWALLIEASEYYVNIYGGKQRSVLAEMILYYK